LNRIGKYFLKGIAALAVFLLLIWVLFWAYVTVNKKDIISRVKEQLQKQVEGQILIGDLSPDFTNTFPFFSIRFKGLELRDPSWDTHRKSFLKAEKLYVRLDTWELLSLKIKAKRLTFENGTIYLYVDEQGRKNLVRPPKEERKGKKGGDLPDIYFRNVRTVYEDKSRNKLDDIFFRKLKCSISSGVPRNFSLIIDGTVHELAFNITQGTYLREKKLTGNFVLQLSDSLLSAKNIALKIDKQPVRLDANFYFTSQPHFSVVVIAKNIDLRKTPGLLQERTEKKILKLGLNGALDIKANITGPMIYKQQPLVEVFFDLKKGDIKSPAGDFTNCSFEGRFINEVDNNKPRSDPNSAVEFKNFKGSWEKIPLWSNKITIVNLIQPFLACDVHSNFDLHDLNSLTGSNTIHFTKGRGRMDLFYKSSLVETDSISPYASGDIHIAGAEIKYIPRNLSLTNCNGTIQFKGEDVVIDKLKGNAGKSFLIMNGSVSNLLTLLNKSPEKLILAWNIYTPELDLNDFLDYIGKRRTINSVDASTQKKLFRIADKVDRMLKDGTAELSIRADKFIYKDLKATGLNASVSLLENQVRANNVSMSHAGGILAFNGTLIDAPAANLLSIRSNLQNVNIPELFASFKDFGQDAITPQNMKGVISATISLNAALTDHAVILPGSLNSVIDFTINNGELIHFDPLVKISETAFKKRDFSDVKFAELKNKLQVNGSAVHFNTMEIRSNVLALFVEGIYDTKKGTDMSIRIPVGTIFHKADDGDKPLENKGTAGPSIHLHAKTGADGKLNIGWDPLHKAAHEFRTN
jgi:hypothetical protein